MGTKTDIARRIKERRQYLERTEGGFSQEAVGCAIGIGRVGYAHYENGVNDITAPMLAKIAKVLKVKVSYLLGEETEEEMETDEVRVWYTGTAPHLRPVAKAALRALYEASDREERMARGEKVLDEIEAFVGEIETENGNGAKQAG